jgi:ubiquitin carboxyl-terminal hydrolase 1
VLIGLYFFFKILELLGYPVWLWLHQGKKMALELASKFPSTRGTSTSGTGPDEDDNMQKSAGSMLSGVFGLNNGLLSKGFSGVTGALSKSYRNVPAGLGNWDNSCYQNSVIQGMASLPSLRDYLSKTTSEHPAFDSSTTNGALFEMINKLNDPGNHGQNFWVRGKLKNMSTFQQQDAQEYFSKILDELDKEVQTASRKRRSSESWLSSVKSLSDSPEASESEEELNVENEKLKVRIDPSLGDRPDSSTPLEQPQAIPNPLDGLLAQRVGCTTCGFTEGLSLIPFNCITVPLGRQWAYDVRECLDEYTSLEYIEGVECAKCTLLKRKETLTKLTQAKPDNAIFASQLQAVQDALDDEDFDDKSMIKRLGLTKKVWQKSTKSRQAVVARAPKSLVLHVNRSIFDEMTGAQYKNNAKVLYPQVLDLGNWCLGSHPSDSQKPDASVEEAWPRDPRQSMLGDAEEQTNSPFQYTLKAVVTHYGNHGNGHYVCYREQAFKVPTTAEESETPDEVEQEPVTEEQWWRLSDESVYESSAEDALRQGNVFMLFYERQDPDASRPLPSHNQSIDLVADQIALPVVPAEPLPAGAFDDTAAEVPLPDDDNDIDLESLLPSLPVSSPQLPQMETDLSITVLESKYPIESGGVEAQTSYPTPPPDTPQPVTHEDTETSETEATNYDSEGAPSTQLTSDDDADVGDEPTKGLPDVQSNASPGPHMMRTAGNVGRRRGTGSGASLPMVTAT